MSTREVARDRAMELAMKYEEMEQLVSALEAEGLGGLLDESELEQIFVEGVMVRRMLPPKTKKTLPRVIGVITILMGIAAVYIGSDGSLGRGRQSPRGYGYLAIILGVVLIVKPGLGKSDI